MFDQSNSMVSYDMLSLRFVMVWSVWNAMGFLCYVMRFLCYPMVYVVKGKHSATVNRFNINNVFFNMIYVTGKKQDKEKFIQ